METTYVIDLYIRSKKEVFVAGVSKLFLATQSFRSKAEPVEHDIDICG